MKTLKTRKYRVCSNCDYWDPDDKPDKYGGNCHRYPPEFSNLPLKAFPQTFKDDWCGEWILRKVSK